MKDGRKQRVMKNVTSQMAASLLLGVIGFLSRKIFLVCLGDVLQGLNGLLNSIIGMLSLMELGVGEAINFSLYEPLARNDQKAVAAIVRLYRKMYIGIGSAILLIGTLLIPFLHHFIKTEVAMKTAYIAYGLFLLDTFLSYSMAYNRNIICADQKDYIVTTIDTVVQICASGVQMLCLLAFKNYFLHLAIQVVTTFARNLYISVYVRKKYPYICTVEVVKLSKEYIAKLRENVKALFAARISTFCVSGTDNMLLSAFSSLSSVMVLGNYTTIFRFFNKTFNSIFARSRSVVGNYLVLEERGKCYQLFKRIFFLNFLVTSYLSIGMLVVCNEVIAVWLGGQYTWAVGVLAVLVLNNYTDYILQTCEAFRGAAGLYSPRPFVKYLTLFEGALNLIASLVLVYLMEDNVLAIFLGTTISSLIPTVCVPWIVYRFLFNRPLKEFFQIYFRYFSSMLVAMLISGVIFQCMLTESHVLNVCIGIAVCTAVTCVVYFILYRKTDEFDYALQSGKRLIADKLRKGRN